MAGKVVIRSGMVFATSGEDIADGIPYDNSVSSLKSDTIQDAIDELDNRIVIISKKDYDALGDEKLHNDVIYFVTD